MDASVENNEVPWLYHLETYFGILKYTDFQDVFDMLGDLNLILDTSKDLGGYLKPP